MHPRRHRLLGQSTKRPLSNFEHLKPWKYKQRSGQRPDPKFWLKTENICANFYQSQFTSLLKKIQLEKTQCAQKSQLTSKGSAVQKNT